MAAAASATGAYEQGRQGKTEGWWGMRTWGTDDDNGQPPWSSARATSTPVPENSVQLATNNGKEDYLELHLQGRSGFPPSRS
jgi:hypothetical protein